MKTAADILTQLAGIPDADRQWIIEKLSLEERHRLLGATIPAKTRAEPPVELGKAGAMQVTPADHPLRDVDMRALAQVLRQEPAWVIAALLKAGAWLWRQELLDALPEHQRRVVMRAGSDQNLTARMSTSLLRAVAARIEGTGAPPAPSAFEQMVGRLSALRSRRRITRL